MEWWTSEEINTWERARRRVAITRPTGGSPRPGSNFTINVGDTLKEATLLLLLPQNGNAPSEILLDGNSVQANTVERYGHRFAQVTADLAGEAEISLPTG